ncbi:MAG: hypothetical protein O8C64_07300 [Candidatus Methanoperedens sp.]|nr:hypothetical protein [Candidatus Methanoperedens sp.]MCZ7383998.1 hypothetical protein [Candidatus Methanoperedens sp.]
MTTAKKRLELQKVKLEQNVQKLGEQARSALKAGFAQLWRRSCPWKRKRSGGIRCGIFLYEKYSGLPAVKQKPELHFRRRYRKNAGKNFVNMQSRDA